MKAPRIRRMRRREDIDGLVEALAYVNFVDLEGVEPVDLGIRVRIEALRALADHAGPGDAARIAVALRDQDPRVRQIAVRVIRGIDPRAVVDLLAATVVGPGDPDFVEARLEALDVLEELAGGGAAGMAARLASAVVNDAAASLDQVTQDAFRGFLEQSSRQEVAGLIADLIDRLPTMNGGLEHAQVVLSWLGPASVDPLIQALDREGGYREPAAAVLGAIRDTRALEPLTSIIDDRRADVRRVTVWALGELRDPRAAEPLMKATMDNEYVVRKQAGEALDAMGSIALMAGVANMIRSLDTRGDRSMVARLVEEGLERTPPSDRGRGRAGGTWAPRFMERLLAGSNPS